MTWRQLPNTLTVARIALVGPLLWLMHVGDHGRAMIVLLLAASTDAMDGALARRYGWQTRFGGLLDPIADKVLVAACFIGLWSAKVLPGWMLALVLGRDVLIVAGALAWQALIAPLQAAPSRLGKITTLLQLGFVLVAFVQLVWVPFTPWLIAAGLWIVAACTVASGLDYVITWSRRAIQARAARRV